MKPHKNEFQYQSYMYNSVVYSTYAYFHNCRYAYFSYGNAIHIQ